MEFLVLWLGTTAASFAMELANEFKIFKDAADAGYKIDTKRLSEFQKQLSPDATKITFLSMLIPLYNVMSVFQRVIQYENARPMILDQLSVTGVLEEMLDYEKKEYSKRPTGLNALIVPLKAESKLSKATKVTINGVFGESVVYCEIGKTSHDINILSVSGPVSRLTVEEQKEKVIETMIKILRPEVGELNNKEISSENIKESEKLDLSDGIEIEKDEETSLSSSPKTSISEQKQTLEKLKRELLEEQKMSQSNKTDKGPTLTKRK